MSISFNCPCGRGLKVAAENAGKRVRCPSCQAIATVPTPQSDFEVVDDSAGFEVVDDDPPKKPLAKPVARPVAKSRQRDDDDDVPVRVKKKEPTADDDEPVRPRKSKRKRDDDDETEDAHDRAARLRATSDPHEIRQRLRRAKSGGDNTRKYFFIAAGLIALMIGCGMMFMYYEKDETYRGKYGRQKSRFNSGIGLAIAGLVVTGCGLAGWTGGDD